MLIKIYLIELVFAVIVCFTSFTEEDEDKATQAGIRTYSLDEFLNLVSFFIMF